MKTDTISPTLQTFLAAYIECALWSSNDESNEQGGEPLDKNYSEDDLAPNTKAQMMADCMAFMDGNAALLESCGLSVEQQGHDFWLSRNGHGAGFFDRCFAGQHSHCRQEACDKLQTASEAFKECNLYIGDNGLIYC